MDELFGVSMNLIAVVAVAVTAVIFLLLAYLAVRNPVMFKQGLRNIPRRKTQTALIVFGLMLATVIMTAAFSTGDTVASTATNDIYDLLGEIDEIIEWDTDEFPAPEDQRTIPATELERLKALFAGDDDIEAFLGLVEETLPIISLRTGLNEANATIIGLDPDDLEPFGGLPGADAAQLTGNAIVVNEDLAEALDVEAGDTLTLLFEGRPVEVSVVALGRDSVLTGRLQIFQSSLDGPGGTVNIAFLRSITGRGDTFDLIAVTNTGDARSGMGRTDVVVEKLEAALQGTPYEVNDIKKASVDLANLISSFFTTFFVVFGLFSIAAGVLLIFLIFIMLAAERKPEMGMARAVGARRRHLVESFLAEGMGYDLGSALVGLLAGMGVTIAMVALVNSTGDAGLGIDLRVTFTLRGLLVSFCLGVIATFLVITVASVRASRLNIVAAIRDLPESRPRNPEQATLFGYLRGLLNAGAAFGFFLGFLILSMRFPDSAIAFSILALIGLVGPFIYLLRGTNFYLPADERLPGAARLPLWPFFTVVAIPFYSLALLLVRLTRDRRPRSVPIWLMFAAVVVPPVGIVLAALQDRERPIAWGAGLGAFGALIGVVMMEWGLSLDGAGGSAFLFSAGVSLVLLWIGTLLRHFHIAERASMTTVSLLVLLYWYLSPAGVFDWLTGELSGDFEMFFLSGLTMVTAGTFIVTYNADILIPLVASFGSRLGRLLPAVKMAAAYPLVARVRTGLTIAMIGLIMFALITFSTINQNFVAVFFSQDAKGGWSEQVFANPNNEIDDLLASLEQAGVDTSPIEAAAMTRWANPSEVEILDPAWEQGDDPADQFQGYWVLGGDSTFLAESTFAMKYRAAGYESDEAVWEAMASGGRFAVIDGQVATGTDGFGVGDLLNLRARLSDGFEPFTITFRDPGTRELTEATVIGQVDDSASIFFSSIMVHLDTMVAAFPDSDGQVWYVRTSGVDSRDYARTIEASLVQASAESLDKLLDDQQAASGAFLLLFQGFMGLGLVVGIAALGVIAFRAVVERRQQIGMLRAIGYQRSMVAWSFLLESGMVALSGILMGLVMGVSFAWVLWTSGGIDEQSGATPFTVPWLQIAVICGIALAASLLMTYFPARAASRVAVAEALRYE